MRWLSASARVGAARTGHVFAEALLDHYRQTLGEMQQVGYVAYARRQLGPYFRAAAAQFSPKRPTLTDGLLDRLAKRRARRAGGSSQRGSWPRRLRLRDGPAAASAMATSFATVFTLRTVLTPSAFGSFSFERPMPCT